MTKQIGSVEIKRLRVYNAIPGDDTSPQVAVQPGIFPVMRSGERIWWTMRGDVVVTRPAEFERLWEGALSMRPAHDEPTGESRRFDSRVFTPAEFAALMAEPTCQEGPEQRLAIKLFEPLEAAAESEAAR